MNIKNYKNCIYITSCKVTYWEIGNQHIRNNHHTNIKTKKIQEPVGELFNLSDYLWEAHTVVHVVIGHRDERQEKFKIHRLKLLVD